ncbi:unnamed protein product [Schistosoma curassoni]|uniref:IL4_i_Ig domain-containing protein n=1 Tax=Schistosoma curassoni TaxID=6186 RepID=A0A183KXD7_9TREM|nr:unnamed protein product [Schistosoma curassoni]
MKGFKVNIADRVNDDTQKLMYLIHYCEGIAKDAIEHCVLLPEKKGYTEAIKILHERFGRPHDIADTYALLDNGSDSTLLLSDVAKQVGISGTVTRFNISSVTGASSQNAKLTNFEIESLDKTNRIKIEGAYTIDNLPIKRAEIPPTDFQERWKHLKGVQLPTIACNKVGLLLGFDVPEAHWVLDQRIGKPKQPYASLTMLGWALFGPTGQPNKTSVFMNCLKAKNSFEEDILKLFEHEFSENKYSDKVTMSLCDKTIMEITDKQTVLLEGHYQVPIPWKVDWHSLPRNKREIEKRLIYYVKGDRSNNSVRIPGSTERIQRTLGLCWHTQSDCFTFERPITKRDILSCASSLYDPLGFLAPLSLTPKRILQQLRRKNYGWDEMIDGESRLSWEGWLAAVAVVSNPTTTELNRNTSAWNKSSSLLNWRNTISQCVRLYMEPNQLGDWFDICDSNELLSSTCVWRTKSICTPGNTNPFRKTYWLIYE